jgi:hypothetical protein
MQGIIDLLSDVRGRGHLIIVAEEASKRGGSTELISDVSRDSKMLQPTVQARRGNRIFLRVTNKAGICQWPQYRPSVYSKCTPSDHQRHATLKRVSDVLSTTLALWIVNAICIRSNPFLARFVRGNMILFDTSPQSELYPIDRKF